MVVTDILYSLANDAAVRFSGGSSFLRIVFRIWALYRAIGHLLFHLVLGDNYYGRARARRNSRQPDQIKSTVGILPGYPRRSMVYSGIATPLSMYGAGRLSAGLSIRVNRSNMAGNYLNRSGNAGTLKGYGSIQTTVIPCVVQHSQYGLLH